METIKLNVHIGDDGILKIETPTPFKDVETEVVLVLQAVSTEPETPNSYPADFFARLDAIEADDMLERPEQPPLDVRDPIE